MEKYISSFNQIYNKFEYLDNLFSRKINIYLIGGSVLLYNDLKPGTKDIDLVVTSKSDKQLLTKVLEKDDFLIEKPNKSYKHMKLEKILIKDIYRIDIFENIVCGKLFLSKNMIKRSKLIKEYKNINLYLCSIEDVFVFKSITERDGDIDDCESISLSGTLKWNIILKEIKYQIQKTKQDVWITYFEEKLNYLEDRGVLIPIIKDVRKLSLDYYDNLEKRIKK